MVQTKSIVSVGSINLNGYHIAIGSETNASTRINLLVLGSRIRIISELVFTFPNDYLIALAGFNNPILIVRPLSCLFNYRCTVVQNSKKWLSISCGVRTTYLPINGKCATRLTCRSVKERTIDTSNYFVVFTGMVGFSRCNLVS